MAKSQGESSAVQRAAAFPRQSWEELKKVHAPTRQETILVTLRVLAMIAIFGSFLGVADLLIGSVMQAVLTS